MCKNQPLTAKTYSNHQQSLRANYVFYKKLDFLPKIVSDFLENENLSDGLGGIIREI